MAKYLYNGIELPALPEWDKTAFPYVYIYHTTPIVKTIYNVHFTSSPYYGTSNRGEHCIGRRVGDISYSWMEGYTAWVLDEVSPWSSEGVLAPLNNNLRWSNFDILNADGSVYLPASYPIDAETGAEIHDYELVPVTTTPIPADLYFKGKSGKVYNLDLYRVRNGAPILQEKTVTENGEVTADEGYEGLKKVTVNVATGGGITYEGNYLTFSSVNSFTIATENSKKNWGGTLYYSTNTETWNEWSGTAAIASAEHEGEQRIYMRGLGVCCIGNSGNSAKWALTGSDIKCSGNIMNLLDYEVVAMGRQPAMAQYCFSGLFYGCTALTSAPELPATDLATSCYSSMFYGCTALTSAPELPATVLADTCYSNMFNGCTSLTSAPELPATVLKSSCYNRMFYNCTALTSAPELPATTLASYCYQYMFYGCTGLTTLTKLPATTLAGSCYQYMFYNCTGIKLSESQTNEYKTAYRIPTSGTGTTASSALSYMFKGTGGTFTGEPAINTTYYTSNTVV